MQKIVVAPGDFDKLNSLADNPPGSTQLVAVNYEHYSLKKLAAALNEHGAALTKLQASLAFPQHPYTHDWRDLDFAAACPHLTTLSLGRCRLNETVLCHPTLRDVTLENCRLFTADPLRLGYADSAVSRVAHLKLLEVNWGNLDEDYLAHLAFGPQSPLETFIYYGDEDDIEVYPETIIFDGCPELIEVGIHVCGAWLAKFRGDLPQLTDLGLSSARYGDHRLSFDEIGDGSSAYAQRFRDGKGPFAEEQYLFVGEFRHLNLDKVRHVITQLGGEVVESPSPALTFAVLNDEAYAAYEAGTPTPQVAEVVALVEQGAEIEIYDLDAFRNMIYGWY